MKHIYINTLPKKNTKKDGSVFFTVLVGLNKKTMIEKVNTEVDLLTMQVFENQLQTITDAFNATKKAGFKLAIEADDVVITEPKVNTYVNANGEMVTQTQASVWGEGNPRLVVLKTTLEISDELKSLLA